jgi:L-seryl-tRNA(Ser) seleniumtransferase
VSDSHPHPPGRRSRRRFLQTAPALGLAAAAFPPADVQASQRPTASAMPAAADGRALYQRLGVRPLINGRGTLTIIGGSMELPAVREAKSLANQHYAHLDELMDAAGRRLAELTGAEWGMVSSGCAAAMTHATAACVAGGNPDLHVRIPDLRGFAKDEVIIPTHSRNVYDAAIRAVGVRIVEADTPEELERAIGPRTAMIYVFANPRNESGPMSLEAIAGIARPHGVPIMVDAAAEVLTVPNIHLQRGATLVGYSGGKILRGPQSAGLLLGRKDLVQAAWIHSAPHHGFARAMKVGREEVIGMVVAVEQWLAHSFEAEWAEWVRRCEHIADRVSTIPGVSAIVMRDVQVDRSNRSPRVTIRWTAAERGLTGETATALLYDGEPRIAIAGGGRGRPGSALPGDTGIAITTSMLAPGDERIIADRVHEILSATHTLAVPTAPRTPVTDLTGQWEVEITYTATRSTHRLHLQQEGSTLQGMHQGDFVSRDVTGSIDGSDVSLVSRITERTGDSLNYRFSGTVSGETLSGTLDMGEYRSATWTARKHTYG